MPDYIASPAESDEYVRVGYRASVPRRRDFWRVLLGRYSPEVIRTSTITAKGFSRELKRAWSNDSTEALFFDAKRADR